MGVQINGSEGNVIATKGTYSGNITIGGTLTYEDVTNIDSVGLVTARTGIEIGARPGVAASISVDGNMIVSGISTFGGDVQVPDKIIHSGDTNTAIRFPAADTITSETGGSERLRIDSSGNINFGAEKSVAFPSGTGIQVYHSANPRIKLANDTTGNGATDGTQIYLSTDGDTIIDNKDSEDIIIHSNASEKLRIGTSGQIGIAGANYGTSGQVLQSQGSGSAVQWASVGGMTLLSSATLSSSGTTAANITFSTTGYEYLYGKIYGVTRPSNANISDFGLRWNGTSSNVYKYVMQRMDNNGSISTLGNNSANQFYVNMTGVAAYTSGINQAVFELHLVNDGVRKPFNMKHGGELSGGAIVLTTDGFYDNTASITSLEITTYDTDINGGTLKLYGVR